MSEKSFEQDSHSDDQEQQRLMSLLGGMPPAQAGEPLERSPSADAADAPGPDQPGIPMPLPPPMPVQVQMPPGIAPDGTYAHESAHHYHAAAVAAHQHALGSGVAAGNGGPPGYYPHPAFPHHLYPGVPPPQPPTATKPKPRQHQPHQRQKQGGHPNDDGDDGQDGGGEDGEDGEDSGDEYVPDGRNEPDPDEPAPQESSRSRNGKRNGGSGSTPRKTRTTNRQGRTSIDSSTQASNGQYDLPPPQHLPHPNYQHLPPHFPQGDPYAGIVSQSTLGSLQSQQTQSQSQPLGDDGSYGQLQAGEGVGGGSGEDGMEGSANGGTGGKRRQRKHQNDEEWNRQRKDNHKEVERRRRGNINQGINELAAIVPNSSAGEKAKGAILTRAVQYIHSLKENEARNIEKWTLEKLLMDQAMGDLQAQLEDARRRWEMELETRLALEREVEVLKARLSATTSNAAPSDAGEVGQKRQRVD